MKPEIGAAAPDFSLAVCGGEFEPGATLSLADLAGKWVLLYFYPKDDTPGCTRQACELRDEFGELKDEVLILGASPDGLEDHEAFLQKYELPFALLSDPSKQLMKDYGVWVEKSMYGNTYMGVERSSFLIDPQGKVASVLEKVQPAKHVKLVRKALDER